MRAEVRFECSLATTSPKAFTTTSEVAQLLPEEEILNLSVLIMYKNAKQAVTFSLEGIKHNNY